MPATDQPSTTGAGGFLDVLPRDEVDLLLAHCRRRSSAGAVLFLEGDPARDVHVVLSGMVKIVGQTSAGRSVLLALRGAGELVGELAALDGGARSATAACLDDVVHLRVPTERLLDLLTAHPAAALHLLKAASARLRDADQKRVEYTVLDSAGRVASRLVELAERFGEPSGDGLLLDLGLTQDEIASWTGASREALSRALTTFRDRGWITTERRRMVLVDVNALQRRATPTF